jgi:hypothetical protein
MAHNRPQILMKADVRFGSEADMCGAKSRVRFTTESDRKSGHQLVMSAGEGWQRRVRWAFHFKRC